MNKMMKHIQCGFSRGAAPRLSPSPSRGGPGWGWCSFSLGRLLTPSPPNPPLEGEGFGRVLRPLAIALFVASLTACAVGPDYHKPDLSVPAAYKENADWHP